MAVRFLPSLQNFIRVSPIFLRALVIQRECSENAAEARRNFECQAVGNPAKKARPKGIADTCWINAVSSHGCGDIVTTISRLHDHSPCSHGRNTNINFL